MVQIPQLAPEVQISFVNVTYCAFASSFSVVAVFAVSVSPTHGCYPGDDGVDDTP